MRFTTLLLALLVSLPLPLSASGGQEPPDARTTSYADKTFTLYALAEKGTETEIYAIERMTIPSHIALSAWTTFEVRGGELSTGGSAAYALRSTQLAATGRADGLIVLEYRITAALPGAGGDPRSSQQVVFTVKDCLGKKGELLYQPARLAVIRAVGLRKLTSGSLRIAEITYSGGSFTARVEFR
jgi:hypothetical protein